MRSDLSIHEQRNRLYRSLPPYGTLSGGQVLEESKKLDALVLRYYRTLGFDAQFASDAPNAPGDQPPQVSSISCVSPASQAAQATPAAESVPDAAGKPFAVGPDQPS